MSVYFYTQNEMSIRFYEKDVKTIVYGLLSSCNCRYCFTDYTRSCRKQAILDGKCRACRYIEKVMNDSSIGSTFMRAI